MRILVTGDREWSDGHAILKALRWHRATAVVHGCARGADTLAGVAAAKLGLPVFEFPARWDEYGKAAGPIRNQQMLDEGKPDLVLAFHPDLRKSRGTADMVRRAENAGLPVMLYGPDSVFG